MAGITTIGAIPPDEVPPMEVDGDQRIHIARATYSFAEHGGGQAVIGLGVFLPDNAVVVRSYYEVTDALLGGGGCQFSLSIPTDDVDGILASAVVGGMGTAGYHEGIQLGTAASFSTKTTGARELSTEITVADATAGIMIVYCEYVVTA